MSDQTASEIYDEALDPNGLRAKIAALESELTALRARPVVGAETARLIDAAKAHLDIDYVSFAAPKHILVGFFARDGHDVAGTGPTLALALAELEKELVKRKEAGK